MAVSKAAERGSRESTKEERRRKKLEPLTEKFSRTVGAEAALKRAAELVFFSNRVPIEITGVAAATQGYAYSTVNAARANMKKWICQIRNLFRYYCVNGCGPSPFVTH
jgi:hypothetical protein